MNAYSSHRPDLSAEEPDDFMTRLWREFVRGLRGRLVWAAALGLVLGAGAAWLAYESVTPIYRSQAMLRINSYTPKILYGTENTGLLPRYDNYLGAQVELIRSRRVTDLAMRSDPWSALGRPNTPETQREFRAGLSVNRNSAAEMLVIGFVDPQRDAAGAATRAMVEAYLQVHTEGERVDDLRRLRILEDRQSGLTEQLAQVRQDMTDLASDYGIAGISTEFAGRVTARTQLELDLTRLKEVRAEFAAQLAAEDQGPVVIENAERQAIETRIAAVEMQMSLLKRNGFGPGSLPIRRQQNLLEELQMQAKEVSSDVVVEAQRNQQLQAMESSIRSKERELERVKAPIEDIRRIVERINQLQGTEASLQTRVAETRSRIEALNLEAAQDNRIEILSNSDVGFRPINFGTVVSRTSMAGMGGLALGFAVVGGLGMRRREVRDSRDVMVGVRRRDLLGMLPVLESSDDPSGMTGDVLQRSIEHLRTMVQLRMGNGENGTSLAVTGPVSGSGKTTTSLLLARSFAEAGTRTLLIDLDAEGRGLSKSVRRCCIPRLGDVLVRDFHVDPQRIARVLKRAHEQSAPLGQMLVEEGVIDLDTRDAALHRLESRPEGIVAAMTGSAIEDAVTRTRWSGLDALLLPEKVERSTFGQRAIAHVLEEATKHYDLVLMDTGPTPGSVEGAFGVATADHTLVVVARGDKQEEFDACDGFLRSVHARVVGYVLNRCDQSEIQRSPLSLSISRRSINRPANSPNLDLMVTRDLR